MTLLVIRGRVVGEASDWFIPRWKEHGMFVNGNTYWLVLVQELVPSTIPAQIKNISS